MSQNTDILRHLKTRARGLTQLEALRRFGCMRLAARIDELRLNHHIGTQFIKNTHNNGKHARYHYEGKR